MRWLKERRQSNPSKLNALTTARINSFWKMSQQTCRWSAILIPNIWASTRITRGPWCAKLRTAWLEQRTKKTSLQINCLPCMRTLERTLDKCKVKLCSKILLLSFQETIIQRTALYLKMTKRVKGKGPCIEVTPWASIRDLHSLS